MTAGNALRPVLELAAELDLRPDEVASYGPYKAKVSLAALDRLPRRPGSKYVCITAVTPTPLGEGKTVNTIGLALGLNKIGKRAICTLRQPSMGPVFGLKGGDRQGPETRWVTQSVYWLAPLCSKAACVRHDLDYELR